MPRSLIHLLAALLLILPTAAGASEGEEQTGLTVAKVIELLRTGTSRAALLSQVKARGGDFDLTVDDVVRLVRMGASPELIQLMAKGPQAAPAGAEPAAPPPEPPPTPGTLTVKRVIRMYHKAIPPEEIAAEIARQGLKQPPELEELLALRAQGVPKLIVEALARGGTAAQAAPAAPPEAAAAETEDQGLIAVAVSPQSGTAAPGKPLRASQIMKMLEQHKEPSAIAGEISARGLREPLTLTQILDLRGAGATDEIMSAIMKAAPPAPPGGGEAAEQESSEEPPAEEPAPSAAAAPQTPSPQAEDRLWVSSVPAGARVYVSSTRTRGLDALSHDYLAGRTPISLALAPGDYQIVIQKDAGEFEGNLLPAWRTVHDPPDARSVLDNADLTFDPDACCLPGSLSGTVQVRPMERDQARAVLSDQFDGLPPFLFDGESLQVLRVRNSSITQAMKFYRVRKNAGQSRLLVGTFIPAEGDPLDASRIAGLPDGMPYDSYLDTPELEYLKSVEGVASVATVLGVEKDHLAAAVAMLRRAGKAILHQQVEGGLRLVSIAVDDYGRLRLSDRTVRPVDPFAPPPQETKGKKKAKPAPPPPPPPPPLPSVERTVVPGLGLPRLVIDNKSAHPACLSFSDGEFLYVPSKSRREFVVDPGTVDVQALAPGSAQAPARRGTLHFSYHARYTVTF